MIMMIIKIILIIIITTGLCFSNQRLASRTPSERPNLEQNGQPSRRYGSKRRGGPGERVPQ